MSLSFFALINLLIVIFAVIGHCVTLTAIAGGGGSCAEEGGGGDAGRFLTVIKINFDQIH